MATHPGVREVAVIGVPDDELSEVAHAFVVTSRPVDTAELAAMVEETLGDVWVPKEIEFLDELPRTGNGKVDTKALKASWAAAHPAT
jgi:acyl-coenzyme A synthetase/AMP-(fatty) acid ligase